MKQKSTKIVCTIGPSTWDPDVMRQMIIEGMNVARVNGAFANPEEMDKVRDLVRNVSNEVALMIDIKGPEVRLNKFSEEKPIKPGDVLEIGDNENSELFPANYPGLYQYITIGQRVVIGDGDVEMKVTGVEGDKFWCEVVFGEVLKPGKAMNLPGCDYATNVLTEKDKINLKHAMETGWDFASPSFIQSAEAAREVKEFIGDTPMKIIAKIEDQDGVNNIDEILEIVDGVMIARGGLGVELGLEKVPRLQRLLIDKCNLLGKPCIVATQMLESMIDNPRPTRAEMSDCNHAVLWGSDSVMLSGESSAGKYPVQAVKELVKASSEAERDTEPEVLQNNIDYAEIAGAITRAGAELCIGMNGGIAKVLVVSKSGTTARLLTRHNIEQPVYAFVSSEHYMRTAHLSKGIMQAFMFEGIEPGDRDAAIKMVINFAKEKGVIEPGEKVLIIGNAPLEEKIFFPNIFEMVDVE